MLKYLAISLMLAIASNTSGQEFYLGADMSYVNEMEDCGVTYYENQMAKDPYSIFEDNGSNLIRLRLWHTPKWYDNLNDGSRYSDLNDVKISISRAKQHNQNVLLDFHLSDNWADPSKQLVPEAWLPVVENTDVLKDSLYNYIHATLMELHEEDLLPEMVQIGNETNKGILLSPADNENWTLDWKRNSILFNAAIQAVRDIESQINRSIKIVLHVAGPTNAEWLIDGFIENGVTDFDYIGLSYYWAWHKPTSIEHAGQIIKNLKLFYPDKEVIVVETGYIWTNEWNDNASNIITETHPDFHPATPANQRDWLIEFTKEVIRSNGAGVIYWEPAWVSSTCYTQWGQGSHQEHATFFDFDNHLLKPGGIEWMSFDYEGISATNQTANNNKTIQILINSFSGQIKIKQGNSSKQKLTYSIIDTIGQLLVKDTFSTATTSFSLDDLRHGTYIVSVSNEKSIIDSKVFILGND